MHVHALTARRAVGHPALEGANEMGAAPPMANVVAEQTKHVQPPAGSTAIAIDRVSHVYTRPDGAPVETLNNVSLDVKKGELLCLIGPSGCGKTTLLNIIGGLVQQTTGDVKVAGKSIRGPSPREIAFVFQDNTLFPWNTILD